MTIAIERDVRIIEEDGSLALRSARFFEELADYTTDEEWRLVGASGQPAFQNSWVNVSGEAVAAFYKAGSGRVYLKGGIDTGTNNTTAFILPTEYRPSEKLRFSFNHITTPTNSSQITIDTDGTVVPNNGTTNGVTLSGISFRV